MTTAVMNRAYSILNWKAVDEDKRILEGIATTVSPDRVDDVIEPEGVEFELPLPLLYQHNARQPIGKVIDAKVTKKQISVRAQIAPAGVAEFIDEAWSLIKAGLLRGFSIGFRSLEESFDRERGGFNFIRTEWLELSVVTIPMNVEATITAVKSADAQLLAVSGTSQQTAVRLNLNLPGVPGPTHGRHSMTIQETITSFENKRAASVARMTAIMDKSNTEGRTLQKEEEEEYDGLQTEIGSIDSHLRRLKAHETTVVARAIPITSEVGTDPKKASEARSGIVTVKSNLPKGIGMARLAICMYNAKGNRYVAADLAKQFYNDSPEVELELRAAVAAMNTTGSPLVVTTNLQGEFLELLRPATIVGRIPGLRRVPFNIQVPAQSGGGTYTWVGQANAKPVSALSFTSVTLDVTKIAGIIVMTKELMRFSNPAAEGIVRDDMVRGIAKYIDEQFTDPTVAAVATVNPASITNGVTPTASTGTTAAAFRTDMQTMLGTFITNNEDPTSLVLLMSSSVALNLSLRMTDLGTREFPDISAQGGSVLGLPVIVSQSVGARIIALNARDILLADDGPVEIDISEEASIVMDSAPQASPQTTSLVSLWQRNYIGMRADKFINWKKARTTSVAYISNAVYSG